MISNEIIFVAIFVLGALGSFYIIAQQIVGNFPSIKKNSDEESIRVEGGAEIARLSLTTLAEVLNDTRSELSDLRRRLRDGEIENQRLNKAFAECRFELSLRIAELESIGSRRGWKIESTTKKINFLAELRQLMTDHLSPVELGNLIFDLNYNVSNYKNSHAENVQDLLTNASRRNEVDKVTEWLATHRPDIGSQ